MRKLITVLLSAISIIANAQELKINWGPEYKKEGAFYNFLRYGGHTDKAYYVVQQSLSESKLFIYDFKHNPIGKQDIKYKYGKNLLYLNDIVTTKSGNYFLMSSYDESQEKALFAYTMASKSNMLNTNYTKIYEYPFSYKKVVSFVKFNKDLNNDVKGTTLSLDSSKVLYTYSENLFENKSNNQQVTFLALDNKMNILYKVNKSISFQDTKFDLTDNSISNTGDVYLVGKYYENDNDRKTPNYKYHILKFNAANEYKDILVNLKDAAPLNTTINDLENGNVIAVGTYTNTSNNKSLRANGTYSVIINSSGEVISSNIYPFSGVVKEELFGDNDKKAEKGAVKYKLKRVLLDKNTMSTTICLEKDYEIIKQKPSTGSTGFSSSSMSGNIITYYNTDDIIVVRFDISGKKEFETIIYKSFTFSDNDAYNSFFVTISNGNYYFIFNDAKTIGERKDADVSGKVVTDLLQMDKTGKIVSQKTLFGNKDIDMYFSPKLSVKLSKNEILIHGSHYRKYKYGIIYLPE